MVVDCRRANQHFARPPATPLFSGAGFSEVVVREGGDVWFAAIDVHADFYQHNIPEWLSTFCCRDGVAAGSLGVDCIDGQRVHPHTLVYPQLCVVPQGWNWGLALVQAAHEALLDAGTLTTRDRRAVDHRPPPSIARTPMHSLYVDNLLVEGADHDAVNCHLADGAAALRRAGLHLHEETLASRELDMLGVRQRGDPPLVEVSPKRLQRLRGALTYMIDHHSYATAAAV